MSHSPARNSQLPLLLLMILAATSCGKSPPRERSPSQDDSTYVFVMKLDLRNMETYEEQYAAEHRGAYFSGTASAAAPLQGFSPSENVTLTVTAVAGPRPSWRATATHTKTATACVLITNGVSTCTRLG